MGVKISRLIYQEHHDRNFYPVIFETKNNIPRQNQKQSEGVRFFVNSALKTAMLSKIHSYRLLFRSQSTIPCLEVLEFSVDLININVDPRYIVIAVHLIWHVVVKTVQLV